MSSDFLSRWSQRKREVADADRTAAAGTDAGPDAEAAGVSLEQAAPGDAPQAGGPALLQRVQRLRVHLIDGGASLAPLGAGSKTQTQWSFLSQLHALGRDAADSWLREHRHDLGQRSSFDLATLLHG